MSTTVLRKEQMPRPHEESAYMDSNGRIWLWTPNPPSEAGVWRIPGGVVTKANNPVLDAAIKKYQPKTLTRMAPVRRRKA